MSDYTDYLAANVLNEGQIVNYRSLSRALKVHSNLAKQMLYDFHHKQNTKKPGVLHATYLITGRQKQQQRSLQNGIHSQDGGDAHMRSSPGPFPSSSAPEPPEAPEEEVWIKAVTLAKEEDLDDARSQFDAVISLHIYSLGPSTIKDVQVLTDCNRRVASEYASEDPLTAWKQYGTIQNHHVKRRTMRRQAPPPAPAPSATKPKPTIQATQKEQAVEEKVEPSKAATKETAKKTNPFKDGSASSTQEADQTSKPPSRTSSTGKPPTVKRESSSIFKSFAKAKPKVAKQETESSKEPSPAPEDNPMAGVSDDDNEEDSMMLDDQPAKEPTGKSKKEREEELRKMMEAEDEPMEDAPSNPIDAPNEIVPEEKQESQNKEEPIETVTVTNWRRRGRRRVMKKKTVKDEEGYLVTKGEAAWESFSEDEPAPKKAKTSVAPPAAKAKKGGKPGQGNIMSFFSKK